ncbi:MAG: group II truncated hemoglobin [Candidatus Binatia bacterium]
MENAHSKTTGSPRYGEGDASFQAAGGEAGIRRLVDDFYDYMDTLPDARDIRAMHPSDLTVSRDKLARFLCGWLGGPKLFREKYGPITIPKAHAHLPIGAAERDAWLLCMKKAISRQPYNPEFKHYLFTQLTIPAERVRNRE